MELFWKSVVLSSISYHVLLYLIVLVAFQGNANVLVLGDNNLPDLSDSKDCPFDVEKPIVIVTNVFKQTTEYMSNDGPINVYGGFDILVKCRSRSPVKLQFSGLLPNPISSTVTRRISQGIKDSSTSCHEVIATFKSTPAATGRYECIDYEAGKGKSVYIYADGNEPPYLLHSVRSDGEHAPGRSVNGIITGNRAVLPCILTNSSIPITLSLGDNNLTFDGRYRYDPKEGFSFLISEFENPYGTYRCTAGTKNGSYSLDVKLSNNESDPSRKRNIFIEVINSPYKPPEFKCRGGAQMSHLKCENPIECEFLKSCETISTRDCNWKVSNDCSSFNQPFCRGLKKNSHDLGGILFCSNNDHSVKKSLRYFTDLKGAIVTDISSKTLDSNEAKYTFMDFMPVEYGGWENAVLYYQEEVLEFNCNASNLFFGQGLWWGFQLEDGSVVEPGILNDSTSVHKTHYSKTSTIKLNDTRIKKIICFAPKIDSNGWYNISQDITVVESYPPKLEDSNNIITYFELSEERTRISCTASGYPLPTFTWYKDGEDISSSVNTDTNNLNYTQKSTIDITVTASDPVSVVYTCNATNFRASALRNITVTRKDVSLSTDWVLLIAVLIILLVSSVITLGFFYLRNKRADEYSKEAIRKFFNGNAKSPDAKNNNDIASDTSDLQENPFEYLSLPYRHETEIPDPDKNLIIETESGHGNFGIVYKGKYKSKGEVQLVAVKSLKNGASFEAFEDLLAELKIMQYVGDHENVVKFIGGVTKDIAKRQALIVVEYCQFNDLRDYLIKHKHSFQSEIVQPVNAHYCLASVCQPPNKGGGDSGYTQVQYTMNTTHLIQWSYEIASGMEYLTSRRLVHRDLAARNVLLTDKLVTKITDFGLSKNLYKDLKNYYVPAPTHKTLQVPWRWFSIEAMSSMKFSVDSDIWAFGVVMYEIFTLGDDPYQGVPDQFILPFLKEGRRLEKPKYSNQAIYEIMLACWKEEGPQRPRFSELKEIIDAARATIDQPDTPNYSDSGYGHYPELDYFKSDSDEEYGGYDEEYVDEKNKV